MSTTIVVALDGTDKDARALPVAAALADVAAADLHLVHVTVGPAASMVAEPRVADAAARLEIGTHRRVGWEVCESADVATELIRLAAARRPRMLVMATRAATPLGRAIVGSVADRAMRECPVPVVLVPPGAAYMQGRQVRARRFLVPLDGSALAARALDLLLAFPSAGALEYVLLEVVRDEEDRAAAEARLARAAARVRDAGATIVQTAVAHADDPATVIVAAVREELVDAIAMSTRGQGGLRRLLLGSVAEAVVRASELPVLLLTPASLTTHGGVS